MQIREAVFLKGGLPDNFQERASPEILDVLCHA